ncbi:MAG: RNA polymerase subunit sigma [Alcanivoracaceae bacterium]|uniref:sigma-70 family RNA polymerase sigma factor n=1 Tax=Alcanivorax sp. MD8A TaxID=1177157 RepID=UPI000C3E611E|nr:sigma-70 family RNA polymerase sigma factor [Alcanivorax sp. MD8A]MAX55914.1 RNA polymerase subunit sigma [Alcanivoracaceae bacterium]MCG8437517.1 sigma-70 family RNA polymerase sigma factor [Pseudomonadales bacterium]MED5432063.1 sigma-70 family RNA polymerase sigma factor [Pseudomonadota bacterium]PNE04359.1 ECF subfamily RNA polymerase sigma-24 factor [Alcanivorax sp. MD8A]|tara:strand:- start:870 stop:1400 length:531 start_codon:yes stop_codon:yes gene_type:complete
MSQGTSPGTQPLEALYHEHHPWLQRWLQRRLGCHALAADLAQDTFIRILTRPRPLNNVNTARSYLRTIAERLCIDLWRRQSIEQAWLDVLASRPQEMDISPEDSAIIIETFCELDDMLRRLPEKVATAFILSQIEGLTYRDIALKLNVSERTIKNYMARAMMECVLIEARFHEAVN